MEMGMTDDRNDEIDDRKIGCRAGVFSGELKSKQRGQVPVIYIAASSRLNFESLMRSYNAHQTTNQNQELCWFDNCIQLLPMPKTQAARTTTLEALKDLDQHFNACVKIRLRPINLEATEEDWDQLAAMEEFAGLFPEYANADPDPESYTLYLRRTPDTHHLNATSIRQHENFPDNILLPTMAAMAASPPRPLDANNPHSPSTGSHTNRLVAFTTRILRRRANQTDRTHNEDTEPTDEEQSRGDTRTRTSPPGTPPPNKRPWQDNNDPYDDRTNWQEVVANSPHLRSPPHETTGEDNTKPTANNNQFSPLAEKRNDTEHSDDEAEFDDDAMETEEGTDGSQPLIDDDTDIPQSGATANEMETIANYVRTHNPSRLPDIQRYLHDIRSFCTDQDAQDAWDYAQSLIETDDPTVAGPRTGHVVPHDDQGQDAL